MNFFYIKFPRIKPLNTLMKSMSVEGGLFKRALTKSVQLNKKCYFFNSWNRKGQKNSVKCYSTLIHSMLESKRTTFKCKNFKNILFNILHCLLLSIARSVNCYTQLSRVSKKLSYLYWLGLVKLKRMMRNRTKTLKLPHFCTSFSSSYFFKMVECVK